MISMKKASQNQLFRPVYCRTVYIFIRVLHRISPKDNYSPNNFFPCEICSSTMFNAIFLLTSRKYFQKNRLIIAM